METMNAEINDWLKSNDSREYFELLKIETIGADPLHLKDCVTAAMWLKKWLEGIGASAELVVPTQPSTSNLQPPTSIPVVVAERKGAEGAPTVLIYGHYDVQPVDPLAEWQTPPFEPTVKDDGRIYCRGSQDDKGQFFAFLCGIREYLNNQQPATSNQQPTTNTPTVKFVLEGQEESGSGALFRLLEDREFRKRIAADVLLVCDTSAGVDLRPAIIAGLRGVCNFTVKLEGANRDLHSGEYGGIAPNVAQGIAELVASLHNPDGSIAVAGFRDGMIPPSHEELEAAEAGFATDEQLKADIGCDPCGGQRGRTSVQRNSFEPTIEINGIHSGYGGPGSKTVIPCEALAKISMRLVPGQSPRLAYDAVRTHLKDHCPRGMRLSFPEEPGLSGAMRLPLSSPIFRLASDALSELDPRGPVFLWDGASIPVVAAVKDATGAAPLLVGWGQPEDKIHSPNESYSFKQFSLAKQWAVKILTALTA